MRNIIKVDDQTEVLEQSYPVEIVVKKGTHYFIFENEEKEKVIIKCNENELLMTRFSKPKSMMRFIKNAEAELQLATPLGLQRFRSLTRYYLFDQKKKILELHYQLLALNEDSHFADYQLRISWG